MEERREEGKKVERMKGKQKNGERGIGGKEEKRPGKKGRKGRGIK